MILGNPKYENRCILILFATTHASLDTTRNRQRDIYIYRYIYSDSDHQAYSAAYQSNRSKISTIDDIFTETLVVINRRISSFFSKKCFRYLEEINSDEDCSLYRLIFADDFFKSLKFLTQILEHSLHLKLFVVTFAMTSRFSTASKFNTDKTYLAKVKKNPRQIN